MTGRFPHDVFVIIVVPFLVVALGVFLPALLIPAHVHHRVAVVVVVVVCPVVALSVVRVALRRGRTAHRGK